MLEIGARVTFEPFSQIVCEIDSRGLPHQAVGGVAY